MVFRTIDPETKFPPQAVSLFHEVTQLTGQKPSWMSGGGEWREWMCPIYGYSAEVEIMDLLYALVRLLKPEVVIEGGCHKGLSAYALGRALKDNGHGYCVTCDIKEEFVIETAKICDGLPVHIKHCSASELPVVMADFLFLDSDYENRIAMIGRMKPGAIAVIHDTRQEPALKESIPPVTGRIDFDQTWRGFSIVRK